MSNETIMLAKAFDPKKVTGPATVTEKLDGVAADFYVPTGSNSGEVLVRSRQDEPILSVQHIQDWLYGKLYNGEHLIVELTADGKSFKDVSGMVRRHNPEPELVANVYDFYDEQDLGADYKARMTAMDINLQEYVKHNTPVRYITGTYGEDQSEIEKIVANFLTSRPNAEGCMVRLHHGKDSQYKFGRSYGMMKVKQKATADLRVVGFEEAVDGKTGAGKGMVGRINVEYQTQRIDRDLKEFTKTVTIGAGPGKLTHAERQTIWLMQDQYIGKIAEIGYMPDPEYDALREPRFLQWREDKTEPSQE